MLKNIFKGNLLVKINVVSKSSIYLFVYLCLLVIIFSVLLKSGWRQFSQQKKIIQDSRKIENILQDKLSYLEEYRGRLPNYVNKATFALPEKNPVLTIISHINRLQAESFVMVSDLKSSSSVEEKEGKGSLSLSLSATGEYDALLYFLDGLAKTLPLVVLDKIDLSPDGQEFSAEIKITSYWEAYPEKMPSVVDPLVKLTKEENDLLSSLEVFISPVFTIRPARGSSGRTNPFK